MEEITLRKFDGKPINLKPTTLLLYENGDLGCDDVLPDAPVVFPDEDMAQAYLQLGRQKTSLRVAVVGTRGIQEVVRATCAIGKIAFVVDMGPLHNGTGGRQREIYKAYMERATFLESDSGP